MQAQNNYVFGPSIRVSDDPPGIHDHFTYSSGQHLIGCRGDTVYLVWADERAYLRRIYFSRSTDGGNTWSANLRLSSDDPNHEANGPSLTLDNQGNIYVCYGHYDWSSYNVDVYFTKSTDGGLSFSVPILVNDTTRAAQDFPSIAVDSSGQIVYVAWQDTRNPVSIPNFDIYVAKSTDGGLAFGPSVRVDDTGADTSWQRKPSIGCTRGGDTVYVAWWDGRNINYDIYFSRSVDGGLTFGPNILVNDTVGTSWKRQWFPSLWVDNSGSIYVVWDDGYYPSFAKSIDCGQSFVGEKIVSDTATGGRNPSVCSINDSLVFVVWLDQRTYSQTGDDIYFSFSSDGGNSFSPNVRVNDLLGIASAWDWNPTVCVNGSNRVFVAWESDRSDPSHANSDIYCASGSYVGIEETRGRETRRRGEILMVHPNPFRNYLVIQHALCTKNYATSISIYNITGRVVRRYKIGDRGSLVINCVDLPGGVYFVEFNGSGETIVKKVVKLK